MINKNIINNDTILDNDTIQNYNNICDKGIGKKLFNYNIWFKYKSNFTKNEYIYLEEEELNQHKSSEMNNLKVGDIVQYQPKNKKNKYSNTRAQIVKSYSGMYGGDGDDSIEKSTTDTMDTNTIDTLDAKIDETKDMYENLNETTYLIRFLNPPIINRKQVNEIKAFSHELKKANIKIVNECSFAPISREIIKNIKDSQNITLDNIDESDDITAMKNKFSQLRKIRNLNKSKIGDASIKTKENDKEFEKNVKKFNTILKIVDQRWRTETVEDYEKVKDRKWTVYK